MTSFFIKFQVLIADILSVHKKYYIIATPESFVDKQSHIAYNFATIMRKLDTSPEAYNQGRDAANQYDESQLEKLTKERNSILDQKSKIGRVATRLAAVFYAGDLAVNRWQTKRIKRSHAVRNAQD